MGPLSLVGVSTEVPLGVDGCNHVPHGICSSVQCKKSNLKAK